MKYYVYKYMRNNTVVYIGMTNDLIRRINEHASGIGLESKFTEYLTDCEIYYHVCGNEIEMKSLESLLINIYKPELNVVDISEGASTIELIIDWKLYDKNNSIKEHDILNTIADNNKKIASNTTRIATYQEEKSNIQHRISRHLPFYMYLQKNTNSIIQMHDAWFGFEEAALPPEHDVILLDKPIKKWYDGLEYKDGICWVQFSGEFLQQFFCIAHRADWVQLTLDTLGAKRSRDINERVENLLRKNRELTAENDALNQKLQELRGL